MEKISLENFSIARNWVLIKPDPDFEFVELKTPGGIVEIQVGYTSETHGRHFGITGTVLAVPDELVFNKQRIEKYKKRIGSKRLISDEIRVALLMSSSQEIDVDMELELNDKVWFSYLCQINAVTNKYLIDIEGHGMCFLVKYEEIYCYERAGEVQLINGWVWIQRIERTRKTESGIELQLADTNKYENGHACIIKSGSPVREYMDGRQDYPWRFNGGEQVVYASRMGHPIEYSMYRKLTEDEVLCVRRKHIYAVL